MYLSMANLSLPKGRARKLSPKYIGPYKILENYKNNSYLLDLPAELKQCGIHPAFHASLLRQHEPNDDRRFPGRQLQQVSDLGRPEEWSVAQIVDHHGAGSDALFKVEYTAGDHVWLPYHEVSRLEAVGQYLEVLGVLSIKHLPRKISAMRSAKINMISAPEKISMSDFIDNVISGLFSGSGNKTDSRVFNEPSSSQPPVQRFPMSTGPDTSTMSADIARFKVFAH